MPEQPEPSSERYRCSARLTGSEDELKEGRGRWLVQHNPKIWNDKELYFSSYSRTVQNCERDFSVSPKACFPSLLLLLHLNDHILLQFAVSVAWTLTVGLWAEVAYAASRTVAGKLFINILPSSSLVGHWKGLYWSKGEHRLKMKEIGAFAGPCGRLPANTAHCIGLWC